ncbi:unnamed protein product [Urochloa decumbens]|uniref:MATH domain-containing protein n=1 Tax=Urochloa decumbens TaxID=240449 RepID=A0ABC9B2Y3_9POAL
MSSSSSSDPTAALGDAWREPRDAFRFSSFRRREVTSTHALYIADYAVDSLLPHGKCVELKPFRAGGHRWKLSYYPNGYNDSTKGNPTALLRLMENRFLGRAADAVAKYDLSVLDSSGKPLYRVSTGPCHYSLRHGTGGLSGIWMEIKEAEELRQLKDNSLIVRCDLSVESVQEESRAKWFLRRFLQ